MIYFSVCARQNKQPKSLKKITDYCNGHDAFGISISYDAESIYKGHEENMSFFKKMPLEDGDIIVLCHDDLDIISKPEDTIKLLNTARKSNVGFVGLAGSTHLPPDGAWWNARRTGDARGFVFQGDNPETMTPNYFGKPGQVVVLDGCFLAITYANLKKIGLDQPKYLETGWDFYDIHLTYKSHLQGFSNYVVPIITMHESPGIMREGWFAAKDKFLRHHAATLPYSKLPTDKTHGLPKQ
tara:strand:- start:380 stop:1099 length:720 start_codon:yes stop_codon:yes gene_type:complete